MSDQPPAYVFFSGHQVRAASGPQTFISLNLRSTFALRTSFYIIISCMQRYSVLLTARCWTFFEILDSSSIFATAIKALIDSSLGP